MVIAKISEQCWIEMINDDRYILNFDMLAFQMPFADLLAFTGMFCTGAGMEMPDEKICSVRSLEGAWYTLSYRTCTIKICGHALSRFSRLCTEAFARLENICRPEYKQSIQEIAGILREIEEKIE